MENLHCGACMTDFENTDDLNEHLDGCPAKRVLLPNLFRLWNGEDVVGHKLAHFIQSLHKNANIIKRYAYCIADDMDTFSRSKIHAELCEKLDIDYNKFRPFESEEITEMPNREQAKEILWNALSKHMDSIR